MLGYESVVQACTPNVNIHLNKPKQKPATASKVLCLKFENLLSA